MASSAPSNEKSTPTPATTANSGKANRDFLTHLEAYLAKRDGVDKLLKILRYASKIAVASPAFSSDRHRHLRHRLKSFESSVGVSRKAFRLGKFVQDVNAFRSIPFSGGKGQNRQFFVLLSAVAYGGEGIYFFIEQIVWLMKAGLIDPKSSRKLQKISAWAELVGYVGSVGLKIRDLRRLIEAKASVDSNSEEEREKERDLSLKIALKRLSMVQDLADWLMTLSDVWDEDGKYLTPMVLSCAGLLSALISTHKNWISC